MKPLLSPNHIEVLERFARGRLLVAFDYDGTLAPIVNDRTEARMRSVTEELFMKVSDLYPSAVITGRSCRDVAERLGDARVKYVVGNHGLEPGSRLDEFERDVALTRSLLDAALVGWEGIDVEDKRYSLAYHFREAPDKPRTELAIHNAVAALPIRMRMVPGKLVVNVVPPDAPDKGEALLGLRTAEHADAALYVGDDVTDEDVFRIRDSALLSIRVGDSDTSAAEYFLRDQEEIDRLLIRLLDFRAPRPSS